MKKILVTGGAGYIGSHVSKLLKTQGFDVCVYDNLSTGFAAATLDARLVEGDLADHSKLDKLMQEEKFDAIMHFAGSIIVPESVSDPLKYYKNNTENSLNLIRLATENNINAFIFSSTAAVYGSPNEMQPLKEGTPKNPINPYGASKLMTEQMLQDTSFAYENFEAICLRYFNVSGADPDGLIGQATNGATHLIKVASELATGKRELMSIFGTDYPTNDGTCVRDYIHVMDLADAHVQALKYLLEGGKTDIFNCGYGHGYSVKEVLEKVEKVAGKKLSIVEDKRRAGDPAFLVSDVSYIKEKLHWSPRYDDIETIISTAMQWEQSETLLKWKS